MSCPSDAGDFRAAKHDEADVWQAFHSRFMQLAHEEEENEQAVRKDRLLRAYCDYEKHPIILAEKNRTRQGLFCLLKVPETGLWTISDGIDENFHARFRTLATRAAVALGSPEGVDAEDFWLHNLYLDLLENNSDQLSVTCPEGGVILRACVARATYCSRLEQKALESPDAVRRGTPKEGASNTQKSIGRNIDCLRKECGWSYDNLAQETGIDKKSILSHVKKGVLPFPRIRKEYAQAFSKALKRTITALDLEK